MNRHRPPILVLAAAALMAASAWPVSADDHIVTEMSRTYMGQVSPPRATETWLSAVAVVTQDRGMTTITRFDLKKRWTILERNKRYLEEPLDTPASSAPPVRMQEMGFEYVPSYAWKVTETSETRAIDGRTCRKVIAAGEADYAEETREMWVAAGAPIDLKRYHARVTDNGSDPTWAELVRQSPLLAAGIVLESTHVRTPPIAPEMTWVFRITKLEAGVVPPAGIYEIPAGFTRVSSLEELFARSTGGTPSGKAGASQIAAPGADLPEYLRVELTRILLTWDLLDKYAAGIWPGWTAYREVPFLISYPNGVRLLVGHPDPMDGFTPVPGLEVRGKNVLLDRRKEIALPIAPPVTGGGGVLSLGKTKPVQTVDLNLAPADPKAPPAGDVDKDSPLTPELKVSSDSQILINIHELFHCFQREVYQYRFGNLRMNPVADYSVYSELEGIALEKAYKAADAAAAREYLLDFLAARNLKRRSMTDMEANQESEEELLEGTATFSEARILEQLRSGYSYAMAGASPDPYFYGFARADLFLEEKLYMLRKARRVSLEARNRAYSYGCFQALLLTRLAPGWRDGFFQSGTMMDQALREHLAPSEAEMAAAGKRLEDRYPIAEVRDRNREEIRKRDEAWAMIQARQGRAYIVNFKPTGEFLNAKSRGKSYAVGLITIYPEGIERIQIRDAVLEGAASPIVQDQLYYVKWIDTKAKPGEKGYSLSFSRKDGEDTYVDAVFTTGGFTLLAPKILVQETPERVKVTILAKIKEPNP